MRGQAFIVFKEIQSATAAMRALQGFMFYDKPMQIDYAKGKSDVIAKMDGTWKKPGLSTVQRGPITTTSTAVVPPASMTRKDEEIIQRSNGGRGQEESPESEQMEEDEGLEPTALSKDEHEPINRILYIQNLPSDVTDEMLSCLFQQYPGFKEVRLVPGRTDIAFVEYEAGHQAAVAKDVLNGFKLTVDKEMKVTFARRG